VGGTPRDWNGQVDGRIGQEINKKYRLERLIGSGGMASVYQAVHRNGHRVAIKVLHPALSADAELRARFLREGYVANKVNHRGAVRVLDDDTAEDGSVFLVMELLEGETLEARWRQRGSRLAPREVCELAYELLDVLASAHDERIVHRDVKPENLFVTRDGVLKVLDFGIARLQEGSAPQAATRTGRMIGTPAFMPPEQVLGRSKQIDGQTDLWAVGATMFTLASGHYVHEAETMEEMLVYSGSRPARAVATVLPTIPPAIGSVIDQALFFEKERRWPDARAMRAALAAAYRTAYGETVPGSRRSGPRLDAADEKAHLAAAPAAVSTPAAAAPAPATPPAASGNATSTTAGLARAGTPEKTPTPAGSARGGGRGRAFLWAVPAVALLLTGGAVAVLLLAPPSRGPGATSGASSGAVPIAIAPPSPPSAPPSAAEAPIPAPTTPLVAAPAGVDSVPRASAAREAVAPVAEPALRPRPAPVAADPKPHAALAPPISAPPAPKPNCDVPFYVDKQGIQRIRPECK
jgi:eukaryotic-like serine/threonine-protein kinase